MNEVDVFLVADKGASKHDLAALRAELCRAVIDHDHYRVVEVPDPERGPDADRDAPAYEAGVAAWHARPGRGVRGGHRPRAAATAARSASWSGATRRSTTARSGSSSRSPLSESISS